MAMKEYHKVDMETGERIDVLLFDDETMDAEGNLVPIPEDCKLGWTEVFYNPKWDFTLDKWVETVPFEEILAPLRERKVQELNDECQVAIQKGFYHEGDFFSFNNIDQGNFTQQLTLLLVDTEMNSIIWKTENNGIKQFTREQFIETCKAGESHKRKNISQFWKLKEYVMTHAFTSLEELNVIDFSFVVPQEG